jgi:hypothetical protein
VKSRADWRAMVVVYVVTLMKASLLHRFCIDCRSARVSPRETLRSGFPDRTMVALWCLFSLGSIVHGVALEEETNGGEVKSCLPGWGYTKSCLFGRYYA